MEDDVEDADRGLDLRVADDEVTAFKEEGDCRMVVVGKLEDGDVEKAIDC